MKKDQQQSPGARQLQAQLDRAEEDLMNQISSIGQGAELSEPPAIYQSDIVQKDMKYSQSQANAPEIPKITTLPSAEIIMDHPPTMRNLQKQSTEEEVTEAKRNSGIILNNRSSRDQLQSNPYRSGRDSTVHVADEKIHATKGLHPNSSDGQNTEQAEFNNVIVQDSNLPAVQFVSSDKDVIPTGALVSQSGSAENPYGRNDSNEQQAPSFQPSHADGQIIFDENQSERGGEELKQVDNPLLSERPTKNESAEAVALVDAIQNMGPASQREQPPPEQIHLQTSQLHSSQELQDKNSQLSDTKQQLSPTSKQASLTIPLPQPASPPQKQQPAQELPPPVITETVKNEEQAKQPPIITKIVKNEPQSQKAPIIPTITETVKVEAPKTKIEEAVQQPPIQSSHQSQKSLQPMHISSAQQSQKSLQKVAQEPKLEEQKVGFQEPLMSAKLESPKSVEQVESPLPEYIDNPYKKDKMELDDEGSDSSGGGGIKDKLLHRLPANYFMKDDDEEDIEAVVKNITNMRAEMLGYVQENAMDANIQDIKDIIEPEKFIAKHYQQQIESPARSQKEQKSKGKDAPPNFLFEQVLKEAPKIQNTAERIENASEGSSPPKLNYNPSSTHDLKYSQEDGGEQRSKSPTKSHMSFVSPHTQQSPQFAQVVESKETNLPEKIIKPQKVTQPSVDFWADEDTSPVMPHQQQDETENQDEIVNDLYTIEQETQGTKNQNMEAEAAAPLSFTEYQQEQDDNFQGEQDQLQGEQDFYQPQIISQGALPPGPRVMKMADYFAEPNQNADLQTPSVQQTPQQDMTNNFDQQSTNFGQNSVIDEKKLEQDILDNVNINFLFSKGLGLTEGLIDGNRLYQLVEKIKELAREQLRTGSKDIDYGKIVDFLKGRDLGFVETKNCAFAEPEKTEAEAEKKEKWDKILAFMRNNPKLLMQMLPDNESGLPMMGHGASGKTQSLHQADMVLKRSRVYDKIQEAQKWQQLHKLSQNFMQKRGTTGEPRNTGPQQQPPQMMQFTGPEILASNTDGPPFQSMSTQYSQPRNTRAPLSGKSRMPPLGMRQAKSYGKNIIKENIRNAKMGPWTHMGDPKSREDSAANMIQSSGPNEMSDKGGEPTLEIVSSKASQRDSNAQQKYVNKAYAHIQSRVYDPVQKKDSDKNVAQKDNFMSQDDSDKPSKTKAPYQSSVTGNKLPPSIHNETGPDIRVKKVQQSERSSVKSSRNIEMTQSQRQGINQSGEQNLRSRRRDSAASQMSSQYKENKFIDPVRSRDRLSKNMEVNHSMEQGVLKGQGKLRPIPRPITAKSGKGSNVPVTSAQADVQQYQRAVNSSHPLSQANYSVASGGGGNFSQNSLFNQDKVKPMSFAKANLALNSQSSFNPKQPPKFVSVRDFRKSNMPAGLQRNNTKDILQRKNAHVKTSKYEPAGTKESFANRQILGISSSVFNASLNSKGLQNLKSDCELPNQVLDKPPKRDQRATSQAHINSVMIFSSLSGEDLNNPTAMKKEVFKQNSVSPQKNASIKSRSLKAVTASKQGKLNAQSPSRKSLGKSPKSPGSPGSRKSKKRSPNQPFSTVNCNGNRSSSIKKKKSTKLQTIDAPSNKANHGVEMSVQTDIRGLEHKIMIRPDKFDSDPFEDKSETVSKMLGKAAAEDLSVSQNASMQNTDRKRAHLANYKIPMINWSNTPVYKAWNTAKDKNMENPQYALKGNMKRYTEGEVDYVLDMIKTSYNEFKRTDIMKPFYLKSLDTLKYLLHEQTIEPIYDRVHEEYKEVTLENTMKLLIRCKLAFQSRMMLIQMFDYVEEYLDVQLDMKSLIQNQSNYKVEREVFEDIQQKADKIVVAAGKIFKLLFDMKNSSHRQFRHRPFIFKNQDQESYIRSEINHIRRLIYAFRVKRDKNGQKNKMKILIEGEYLPNPDFVPGGESSEEESSDD